MEKCNIDKEKFESDSLQRHTVNSTRNSINCCSFLLSMYVCKKLAFQLLKSVSAKAVLEKSTKSDDLIIYSTFL